MYFFFALTIYATCWLAATASSNGTRCGIPAISGHNHTVTEAKVFGGIPVVPNSWPWQVALFLGGEFACGGSILDERWILTAGHCCFTAAQGYPPSSYRVEVGAHDLGGMEPLARSHYVSKVVVHPHYVTNLWPSNDFCLLKTESPIEFDDHVSPVCLPTGPDQDPEGGVSCVVTGWGPDAGRPGPRLQALRQANLKIVDQTVCNKHYRDRYESLSPWRGDVISADMICAGNPGEGMCQGDSGGPLVCRSSNDTSRWELVGVNSWGLTPFSSLTKICLNPTSPGVHARTSLALDWIAQVRSGASPVGQVSALVIALMVLITRR